MVHGSPRTPTSSASSEAAYAASGATPLPNLGHLALLPRGYWLLPWSFLPPCGDSAIGPPWGSKAPADTLSITMSYQGIEGGWKKTDTLIGSTQDIGNDVLKGTFHLGYWNLQSSRAEGVDADVEVSERES